MHDTLDRDYAKTNPTAGDEAGRTAPRLLPPTPGGIPGTPEGDDRDDQPVDDRGGSDCSGEESEDPWRRFRTEPSRVPLGIAPGFSDRPDSAFEFASVLKIKEYVRTRDGNRCR